MGRKVGWIGRMGEVEESRMGRKVGWEGKAAIAAQNVTQKGKSGTTGQIPPKSSLN